MADERLPRQDDGLHDQVVALDETPTQPGAEPPAPRNRPGRGIVAYFLLGAGIVAALSALILSRRDRTPDARDTTTTTAQTTPTATATATTESAEEPPPTQADDADAGVREAIERHWRLRVQGDAASLRQAFAFFTGDLRTATGGRDRWARAVREDGLRDATVTRVPVTRNPDGTATARAFVTTNSRLGGCKHWVMNYDMVYGAAVWRARALTTSSTTC